MVHYPRAPPHNPPGGVKFRDASMPKCIDDRRYVQSLHSCATAAAAAIGRIEKYSEPAAHHM